MLIQHVRFLLIPLYQATSTLLDQFIWRKVSGSLLSYLPVLVGVGEPGGNGCVGTGEGVELPLTVGEAAGVTEEVAVFVPVGEPEGEGLTDPFGVGELTMAVKKAA
jgi:hypothetical protein